jgi:hypothetical protein
MVRWLARRCRREIRIVAHEQFSATGFSIALNL